MSIVARCIFCEDIRQEVGGKFSLMGVFMGEMVVQSTEIPKLERLHFFVSIDLIKEKPQSTLSIIIKGPSENISEFKLNNQAVKDQPGRKEFNIVTSVGLRNIVFNEDNSIIEVSVKIGTKVVPAGKLKVVRKIIDDANKKMPSLDS